MEKLLNVRLTELKDRHGLTQADICKRSGIPEGTLGKIFSGETANPRFDTIMEILKAMGESAEALYGEKTCKEMQEKHENALMPTCCDCQQRAAMLECYRNSINNLKESLEVWKARHRSQSIWLGFCAFIIVVLIISNIYFAVK